MERAQGSLEYLVIIAAVLGISAVIILFMTGVFSGQSSTANFSLCKQAAVNCKASKMVSPSDPCNQCSTSCVDSAGKELIMGAISCCKAGLSEKIYSNSNECKPVLTIFSDTFANLNAWTGAIAADAWHANTTFGYDNNNCAYKKNYSDEWLTLAQSTVGYENIQVSFVDRCNQSAGGEYLYMNWYNGTGWTRLITVYGSTEVSWTPHSFMLPASASNLATFSIRLGCYDWNSPSTEYCAFDSLVISGTQK
jgi:hypothetical protein